MNLQEFNALKPGDKIENAMSGSSGEVTEVKPGIVKVRWNPALCTQHLRTYSVQSTIWFHWSMAENV